MRAVTVLSGTAVAILLAFSAPLAASFAPVIGIDGSVYLPKHTDIACQEFFKGIVLGSAINVENVTECQAIAMENGHDYYSFLKEDGETAGYCATASSCDVRSASAGWKVYKRWFGALNSTHADLVPADDDDPLKDAPACLTQVNVTDTVPPQRGLRTCTSCAEDKAFMMTFHKARTGECLWYQDAPTTMCATLNENIGHMEGDDFMCTKIMRGQSKWSDWMAHQISSEFKHHIENNVGGWGLKNFNVARCEFRKETVCLAGKCDSQKLARCKDVCKLKAWGAPLEVEECSAAACETPADAPAGVSYGALLCKEIAMME